MLAVGSVMAVAAHSTSSSATVVAASKHWVYASEAAAIASGIEDVVFSLAPTTGSSMVA
jgi:hypothetical protein